MIQALYAIDCAAAARIDSRKSSSPTPSSSRRSTLGSTAGGGICRVVRRSTGRCGSSILPVRKTSRSTFTPIWRRRPRIVSESIDSSDAHVLERVRTRSVRPSSETGTV
ncbi:MAG TPA: hypothetical protein VGH87_25615 [Polyangiaceae bacterium]